VCVEGCRAPAYEEARSQFDGKVIAEAVIVFAHFGWCLNDDTEKNRRTCELKGSEKTERKIQMHKDLYYYEPSKEMRRLNPRYTGWDITVIGDIHDDKPELLEAQG
jgi:hypothetical protein